MKKLITKKQAHKILDDLEKMPDEFIRIHNEFTKEVREIII